MNMMYRPNTQGPMIGHGGDNGGQSNGLSGLFARHMFPGRFGPQTGGPQQPQTMPQPQTGGGLPPQQVQPPMQTGGPGQMQPIGQSYQTGGALPPNAYSGYGLATGGPGQMQQQAQPPRPMYDRLQAFAPQWFRGGLR